MKDFVDDLYRRASEDPDIPFNEEAWNRMDQKLDYAARKRRRGLFWLFFLLFVSLSAGLLWGIQGMGAFEQKVKKEKYTGPVAGNEQTNQKNRVKTEQNTSLQETENIQTEEFSADVVAAKDPKEQENVNQAGNQTPIPKTAPRLFAPKQGPRKQAKSSSGNRTGSEVLANQKSTKLAEDLAVVSARENGSNKVLDSLLRDHQVDLAALQLDILPGARGLNPIQYTNLPEVDQTIQINPATKPIPAARSWGIGLSAGPDLASVNANGSTAYGLNAGLAFDYRLGKRWVFQASGQYLLKNYIADQKEYVAPKGFWPTRSYPNSTEGTCDMLQWSVDLRYNWLAKPKFQSFVSLGSSSWTILKEEYEFYYAKDYPGLLYHWSSSQDKNYWFSMTQMGIGIEKTIRPGLSLQVNWFAQMPLKGVGNGKVEIYSSGLGFMVHKQMGKLKK
ncbi:MAG: outer membrane beta-barrel protein [Haliscomenobacter sp.]|uniref:outer membrane beta-barrel protein n=1 Tax=Haliscomenobacter sp. TaxID=2717303 RepID=UPI0029BC6FC5|nr:outer membrane beta-barrel protein [Haliscomenobacter sp.]MDX2067929.1 outer membrane beta-barrel protein [Haliscomenobacter sp.]